MRFISVVKLYRSAAREMRRANKAPKQDKLAYLVAAVELSELGMGLGVLEVQKIFRDRPVQQDLFGETSIFEQKKETVTEALSRISRISIKARMACADLSDQ